MKTRLTITFILFTWLATAYGQLWQKNISMPGSNFQGLNIEKTGDGSGDLIVAGNLFDNSFGNTMLNVFRMDEATGNVVYQAGYQVSGTNFTKPRLFDVVRYEETGTEMIAMTGSVEWNGQNVPFIIKVKAVNGDFVDGAIYQNMIQGLDHAQGLHIIFTQKDNMPGFVVGGFANKDYVDFNGDEHKGFALRTFLDLSVFWTITFEHNLSNTSMDYDMVNHITETNDGFFVTGSVSGAGTFGTQQAVLAAKLSSSGGVMWNNSYIHGNSNDVGVDAWYDASKDKIYLLTNYSVSHYFGLTVFDNMSGAVDMAKSWRAYDWNDLDKYGFSITPSETNANNLVISGYDRYAGWIDENGNYVTGETVPFAYEFEKETGNPVGMSYLYHLPYQHPGAFADYFNFWNAQLPLIYYPQMTTGLYSSSANYYHVAYRNDLGATSIYAEIINVDGTLENPCEHSNLNINRQTKQMSPVSLVSNFTSPVKSPLQLQKLALGYEVDSCNKTPVQYDLDFGDAPEIPGTIWMYPTTLANNGARHQINPEVFLGYKLDAEADGQPTMMADGDDMNGIDDEDGVMLPPSVLPGSVVNITVVASVDGYLDAWMDFNANGSWAEAGEHIFMNQFLTAGANVLNFTVPATAATGQTYTRFRFRTMSGAISFDGFVADGEVEDYPVLVDKPQSDNLDFGDAPDNEAGMFFYNTLLANDGARHVINPDIFLGYKIDGEPNGQPSLNADGDDTDLLYPSLGDDEDGITLPPTVTPGQVVSVDVVASVSGYLDAWMDFNLDGDWNEAGEHIFVSQVVPGGLSTHSFVVPATATPGQSYLRFRFRDYPGPITYKGLAQNGEVEDYKITINQPPTGEMDFGDAKYSYATTLALNGARHTINPEIYLGSFVDPEPDGQPNNEALGDDWDIFHISLGDDEDGVIMPDTLPVASTFNMDVTASVSGYLDVWIDLNMNGTWADAGEHIFAILPVSAGVNTLTYTLPATTTAGKTYLRFRFRDYYAPLSYDGHAQNGEVEDYMLVLENELQEELDFGDAPKMYPTLLADNGARHFIDGVTYLGDLIDAEPNGQPTITALGDDLNISDDEDGVTFLNKIRRGKTTTIEVVASTYGYLNTWIDFNKNGSWADAGEQIFVDEMLSPGVNTLTFSTPAAAKFGFSYMRFRFSTNPGLSYDGPADNGEVEDYRVRIYPKWFPVITSVTHIVGIPANLPPLTTGDLIGAFYTNNQGELVCGGLLEYAEDEQQVIMLYGDDISTPDVKDGFVPNEIIAWKVFSTQSEMIHEVFPDMDPAMPNPTNQFAANGLSAILELDALTLFTSPDEAAICLGTMIQLQAFAFGGSWEYTYNWYSNPEGFTGTQQSIIVQPLEPTTFYITISDGLFIRTDSVHVAVSPVASADAGDDITISASEAQAVGIQLNGIALNEVGVIWETSGDGFFDDDESYNPLYFPGISDLENKSVTLVLYATSGLGCAIWGVDSLNVTFRESHTINIKPGWQGISTYLSPDGLSFEDAVEPLGINFTMAYNLTGMLWPEQNINTLGVWSTYDIFIVKSEAFGELTIDGNPAEVQNVTLNPDWNLLPVMCQSQTPVDLAFESFSGLLLVKEIGGSGVYWPDYNVNTIGHLQAGSAYFAYTHSGGTVDFENNCDAGAMKTSTTTFDNPWNSILNMPTTHTVAITKEALSGLLYGDIIGAFTSKGVCAGIVMIEDNPSAIALNGDDFLSAQTEGFEDGEGISYRLYRPATGETFDLEPEYTESLDHSGKFSANGMSAISGFKFSATGNTDIATQKVIVYPNPSNGNVTISGLSGVSQVDVKNAMGSVVLSTSVEVDGKLSLSALPKGVYFVVISTQSGQHTEKLIIQ